MRNIAIYGAVICGEKGYQHTVSDVKWLNKRGKRKTSAQKRKRNTDNEIERSETEKLEE